MSSTPATPADDKAKASPRFTLVETATEQQHDQGTEEKQKTGLSAKKKAWTETEDNMLRELVSKRGDRAWSRIAEELNSGRVGKQCRDRWVNHLSPDIDKREWSPEEDKKLFDAVIKIGTQWAEIGRTVLPNRSDLSIKNRYYSRQRQNSRKSNEHANAAAAASAAASQPMSLQGFEIPPPPRKKNKLHGGGEDLANVMSGVGFTDQDKLRLLIVLGSDRDSTVFTRKGSSVGKFVYDYACDLAGVEIDYVDLLHTKFGTLSAPFHWLEADEISVTVAEMGTRLQNADAFVFITPEYNHILSPGLANFLNHFGQTQFAFKPSLIVSYSTGPIGGARAAMQLREMSAELGCIAVSASVLFPTVQESIAEDGQAKGNSSSMTDKVKIGFGELLWMAQAMKNHKVQVGYPNTQIAT